MSAQNPFQIPTCFKLDLEHRRRERFKKTVVTAVIVSVAVVVGLLIEGCVSERSEATPARESAQGPVAQPPAQPVQTISQKSFAVQPCPVATAPPATPVAVPHATGAAIYLVKAGDTLSHIAKTHGTTIKALKLANKLSSDKISVGQQLKIPAA